MKHKLLTLFLAFYATTGLWANGTEIDGIYYELNSTAKTASVTYTGSSLTSDNSYTGTIVIPSSFTYSRRTYSVTSIGDYAFYNCSTLTSVTIPNSVTSIGDNAFYNCTGLTSVIIPNSVTSIRGSAFSGCTGLTSVIIPNSVTSIGNSAFYDCKGLTKVIITDIAAWCKIDFANVWANPLSNARHLYLGNDELLDINIPNSVTSIGKYIFSGCSSSTSITIPNSVTSIGDYAFYACFGLTSVTIPNSVTSIGSSAFYNCTGLTSVTIPNSVTSIGSSAFSGCTGLTSVTIPNSVTSIGSSAFSGCTSIKSINVDASNINYVSVDGVLFNYAQNILIEYPAGCTTKEYIIPSSVTSIGSSAFSGCTGLTSITIPNSVTSIGSGAFSDCTSFPTVNIPNSVTSIGSSAFSYVPNIVYSGTASGSPWGAKSVNGYVDGDFVYSDKTKKTLLACAASGSISIPNNVTTISAHAFSFCSGVTSVTIPNSVTRIGANAFSGCSGLTSITIPNSVTSIGEYAFMSCSNLNTITIHSGINTIGAQTFAFCTALTSVSIPNTVISIEHDAFLNCKNLSSISIPDSVTSIDYYAFAGCTSLTCIKIPDKVTELKAGTFSGCTSLASVTFPNGLTRVEGSNFLGCSSLTSIEIPSSVTYIGDLAFGKCIGLTSVTSYPVTSPTLGDAVFKNVPANIPLHTFCSSVDAYMSDEQWKLFDAQPFTSGTCGDNLQWNYDDGVLTITGTGTMDDSNHWNCSPFNITKVILPDGLSNIGNSAFSGCHNLTSIEIPNTVTNIGNYAFQFCTSLVSLSIPNSVTSIGENAFNKVPNIIYRGTATGESWGARAMNGFVDGYLVYSDSTKTTLLACSAAAIGSITIPNSVNSIENWAFDNCEGISSVIIGDSVSSIGEYTFFFCENLKSIIIGRNVTSIGTWAYIGCKSLTSITCYAAIPPSLGKDVFCNVPTDIPLYVYYSAIEAYKNADQWKNFNVQGITVNANLSVNNVEYGSVSVPRPFYYLDTIPMAAVANYGYHFTQWSDGNTDNPRAVVLTQDTAFAALFAKNTYTLTASTNNVHGAVIGAGTYNYLDTVLMSVNVDYGYHFTQWYDGNMDNPRTIVVTKDSLLAAEIAKNIYTITTAADRGIVKGDGSYEYMETATLSVTPNYGYHFTQWSDGNTENPRAVVLTQDTAFTALFAKNTYALTASTNNVHGAVTGAGKYNYLDTVSLTVTTNSGYYFTHWSDGNTDNPRVVILTQDTVLVAELDNKYGVSASAEHGSVAGIGIYAYQDVVTLSVTSDYGYHFTQWSDGNAENPRAITLTQDTAFTALFAKNTYTISTSAEHGVVTGAGTYEYLANVKLQVTSNEYGYHFAQWNDGNTDNPRTIVVTKDATYIAEFAKNLYSVTTNAEHGNITILGTPTYQDTISLNVTPDYGYHFTQWSDGVTDNPRSIVVTKDVTYTAEFAKNTYTITTSAEYGIVTGAGTYDYQDVVSLKVTADYGYHFVRWSDGNTNNPRNISVTKDATYKAEFAKNKYSVTVKSTAQYGVVTGAGTYEYLENVMLQATSTDFRYCFSHWNDGNTDNPRAFVLTQDTAFVANFALNKNGTCGDNINWYYANGVLTITGSGAMYDYTDGTQPWILFRDSITSIVFSGDITSVGSYAFYGLSNRGFTQLVLPQTVTTIGAYAFANCDRLTSVTLSASLLEIADYAFSGCTRINDITCMASTSPDIYANTFNGVNSLAYLYVPCDYIRSYQLNTDWSRFDIQCKSADEASTSDLTVTPGTTDATFTWPTNTSADTYNLQITKDGELICTLVFNANGQLTSIAFAPSRNGANKATAATATANGYRFKVTGLSEASHYTYNFDVKDASQKSLKTYTGEFNTNGLTPIDNIHSDAISVEKFIQNGKLYIRTSTGLYDATGRMVE